MATSRVTTERQGHVWLIGLNRPDKYNAFDLDMLDQLGQAFTDYEDDDELWCAVLFAHGDHFTSGLDLAEVGPAFAQGQKLFDEDAVDPLGLYGRERTKPIIQAVQGYCLTIGMELALAADILVAAEETTFGQIEVTRGIMPFGGATLRMPQRTGWGNAMRYLLTGERFDASEAHRIGFVQELAPDAESCRQRAIELAERVASQAPLAVQASLKNARTAVEQGHEAAAEGLLDQARHLMQTEDAMEGLQSFLERREAEFEGK